MALKADNLSDVINSILDANFEPLAKSNWLEVSTQAIRHTRAKKPYELLSKMRPNESDYIRQYRLDNYRAITNEGVVKFNDKSSRIITRSNYQVINKSDSLNDYLLFTNFEAGNGELVDFAQYFSKVLLPCSYEDSNALLVAFPFNSSNPLAPPANILEDGGLAANERVSVRTEIIASDRIDFISAEFFAYSDLSLWPIQGKDGEIKEFPYYWICDTSNWYRLIPVGEIENEGVSTVKYELELWYNHDTGKDEDKELPINILGGTLTKDVHDSTVTYNESFLKPYFEYGDEVINTLSDFQAVKVKSAYPVKVMTRRPCQECNGSGKIRSAGFRGGLITCHSCDGSMHEKGLSPFKDLIVEPNGTFNQTGTDRPPLEYVSPDVNILKFLDESWQALFEMAKKSINLDLLESVVESGEAKKHRLQDLQDMLMKIAGNLFDVMERHLWYVECLLDTNRNTRQMPVVVRPASFEIKNEEMLRLEASEAHPADTVSSLMEHYNKKYAGDKEKIRIKELSLQYAPLLAITDPQELQIRLLGAYNASDLIKRDRAEFIFTELSNTLGVDILQDSPFELFRRADELIRPFLPIQTELFE